MAILKNVVAMNPNAMETFTPPGMGGDARPGRGPPANPAEHLHDRRVRSVPFLPGLYRGADAGRGRAAASRRRAATAHVSSARPTISSRPSPSWSESLPTRRGSVSTRRRPVELEGSSDMRYEMKMPDLATTESEIRIVRWIVGPGQKVARGQPLLEVETDKATMEIESAVSGVLAEVRSQGGEAVSVGQLIAVLEVEQAAPAAVSGGAVPVAPVKKPAVAPASAGQPVRCCARHVCPQPGGGRWCRRLACPRL